MLPFLNLTSTEFLAPDRLQGTTNLVPEASDTLRGMFARILQAAVQPEAQRPAPTGELLPVPGNTLPAPLPGGALELETGLEIAADTGLLIDEVELSQPALGQLRDYGPEDAVVPAAATKPLTEPDRGLALQAELPVTVHVPPAPATVDTIDVEVPVAVAEAAADSVADLMQAPLTTPLPNALERAGRPVHRERAIEWTAPASRSAAATGEAMTVAQHAAGAHEADIAVVPRPGPRIDDPTLRPAQERVPAIDASAMSRAPAEPPAVREDALRTVRDDAASQTRLVQPAAWQHGAVAQDATPEPGHRVPAEPVAAMPRVSASAPAQPAPQPAIAAQTIDIPVQQSGWDSALADRVTLMARGRLQSAELRLTPAELGPLRIQLEIDDGVANVSFQSQHPLTRDALEQAMPRLRELLAENGLSLGQADVRDDSGQQKSRESLTDIRAATTPGSLEEDVDEPAGFASRRAADGLVDTFA